MYNTEQTTAPSLRNTFLTDIESELSSLRNRVQDVGHRLQEAGFYGPPEDAGQASTSPPENNTRSRILDEMRYLSIHLSRVEHQVGQIV
jgi:hypothetical protein